MWPFKKKIEEQPIEIFYCVSLLLKSGSWLRFSVDKYMLEKYVKILREQTSGNLTVYSQTPPYRTFPFLYDNYHLYIKDVCEIVAYEIKTIERTYNSNLGPG